MATKKKMLQAAAGNAGGGGAIVPEGVSFGRSNDYIQRNNLISGSNGKEFTFSIWAYRTDDGQTDYLFEMDGTKFSFNVGSTIRLEIKSPTSSTNVLTLNTNSSISTDSLLNTWFHVMVSIDMTSTSRRRIFLNGEDISSSISYSNYSNADLYLAGEYSRFGDDLKGRLAHGFLDYTYRDLTDANNRRLFITDELKPAEGLADLSPIIYLPMIDADTAGDNSGTGGDFTINGTLDTAQRGPNQYNAAASTFDGSADYLIRNPVSGMSDSKVLNVSFNFKMQTPSAGNIFTLYNGGGVNTFQVGIDFFSNSWRLNLIGRSSGAEILYALVGLSRNFVNDKWQNYSISLDMANTSNRLVYIDGIDYTSQVTFSTYTNALFNLNGKSEVMREGSNYVGGELSDLWFNTTYIDLSASNPFYDTETNEPKFLGEFGELPTGSAPLIYLPLRADDAGNNKGTGGDFTVNSGPYAGARGPSEFLARGTDAINNSTSSFDGSSIGNSNTLTAVMFFKLNSDTGIQEVARFGNCTIRSYGSNNQMLFDVGTFAARSQTPLNRPGWNIFMVSYNSSGTVKMYLNGSVGATVTDSRYTGLTSGGITYPFDMNTGGGVGSLFLTTDYIDVSQEANRLLFIDQLGYPKDIAKLIDSGDLAQPEVFLPFSDPDDLGLNLGANSDFNINGTVNPADDVDPYA